MNKPFLLVLALLLAISPVFISCSDDKKEASDTVEKSDTTTLSEEEVNKSPDCLGLVKDYKDMAVKLIEVMTKMKDNQNITSSDYVDLLKSAGEIEKQIQEMGQEKVGETCWQEFLQVQLQISEAMANAVSDLSQGDAQGAALKNLNTLNDALNTMNSVQKIINP